jgi:hypothetical protein
MSQTPAQILPSTHPPKPKRRFGYIAALWRSAWSKALWQDVVVNWRGIGLFYMLLLISLTSLLVIVKVNRSFCSFIDRETPRLLNQIPSFGITNGVVSLDRPMPYVISEPSNGRPLVVIDTTGKTTAPPSPAGMLITADHIIVHEQNGQTRMWDGDQRRHRPDAGLRVPRPHLLRRRDAAVRHRHDAGNPALHRHQPAGDPQPELL